MWCALTRYRHIQQPARQWYNRYSIRQWIIFLSTLRTLNQKSPSSIMNRQVKNQGIWPKPSSSQINAVANKVLTYQPREWAFFWKKGTCIRNSSTERTSPGTTIRILFRNGRNEEKRIENTNPERKKRASYRMSWCMQSCFRKRAHQKY